MLIEFSNKRSSSSAPTGDGANFVTRCYKEIRTLIKLLPEVMFPKPAFQCQSF